MAVAKVDKSRRIVAVALASYLRILLRTLNLVLVIGYFHFLDFTDFHFYFDDNNQIQIQHKIPDMPTIV